MAPQSYRQLDVWRKSLALLGSVYAIADTLPSKERFAMASQLRRAALSILTNIAEGNGRLHRAEYVHHLSFARGSVLEVEALVYAAEYLGYGSDESRGSCLGLVDDVGRMLTKLIKALDQRSEPRGQRSPNSQSPSPDVPRPESR